MCPGVFTKAVEARERNLMVTQEHLIPGVENLYQIWRKQGSEGCRELCECDLGVPPSWILYDIGQVTRGSSYSPWGEQAAH